MHGQRPHKLILKQELGQGVGPFPMDIFICFHVCLLMAVGITDTPMQDPGEDLSFPMCASRRGGDPDSES